MYNGGAISWRSSQQSITALSTSEAEYMALSDAAKEARSLLKLNVSLENSSINDTKLFEKPLPRQQENFLLEQDCGGTSAL